MIFGICHLANSRASLLKSSFHANFHKWCSGASQMTFFDSQKTTKSMMFTNLLSGWHQNTTYNIILCDHFNMSGARKTTHLQILESFKNWYASRICYLVITKASLMKSLCCDLVSWNNTFACVEIVPKFTISLDLSSGWHQSITYKFGIL